MNVSLRCCVTLVNFKFVRLETDRKYLRRLEWRYFLRIGKPPYVFLDLELDPRPPRPEEN